jgi:hypothetical protein
MKGPIFPGWVIAFSLVILSASSALLRSTATECESGTNKLHKRGNVFCTGGSKRDGQRETEEGLRHMSHSEHHSERKVDGVLTRKRNPLDQVIRDRLREEKLKQCRKEEGEA